MGRKGVGTFTSQNTVLQNNVIMINVPKAIDKTNFNTDADQINYQSRFVAQPIYCHGNTGDYIAIDDTDAQVTTAWASLSVEGNGDILTSTALVPAFSTDMKIQLEVRAVDDTETLYSKVITTIDMFAIKNDSADFIVNNISWKNNNVTVKAQVKDSGFSLPANVDEIRGNGTLTAAFNAWRYDLAAIFGDINYKVLYSIKETDFPYPNTLANNFNLRTWDWVNDGIEFTLNNLDQENNYQIKLILDRDGLSESSGAIMHNNRPETVIELIIQSGTSSFQIANNGIRSTYPNPNDKASTASAMLARTQQHSNEEDVEKGHSVALYDSHIRTGESVAADEPSIGFMTMNHEEIGKIGVESLKKSDGTSIGKHIVLRNDDMEMPVAVRTSGNRLQYWDEGLDIWQDILPAKMVSGMNEHIQWDFTGGESGNEPIVIHMKGMTFTSKDGFKFTTGALTPDSLSVELKEELRGKSLRLNTSNTVFVYDADNNPFPSGQIIDLTVDVQGITGNVNWNIKGYNIEGAEVSIPTTTISNKHIKIDIDSMGNNVQKIVATVSLKHNGEEYTDTLTLLKLRNGLDGYGRGVKSISEWLLSTSKNTGVTKADLGWTKDGYPKIDKNKPYLWKYTSIVYSDDSVEETEPVLVGAFGIDGRSVNKVESYYATSTRASGVAVADLTWVKTPVNPTDEQPYLWNYDRIIYTDNVNPTILGPRVIGIHGEKGETGRGIASITEYYLTSSENTGVVVEDNKDWSTTFQQTTPTNRYLWNYKKIAYTDGTKDIVGPSIIGTHGMKGDSPIVAYLTNDSHLIPTNADGLNANYENAYTEMYIMDGIKDDTDSYEFSVEESSGIVGDIEGNKYTVTSLSADLAEVKIIATKGDFTISKVFTVIKAKQGIKGQDGADPLIYQLETDSLVLTREVDGALNPSSISTQAVSMKGNDPKKPFAGYFRIYEQHISAFAIEDFTKLALESGITEEEYIISLHDEPRIIRYESIFKESTLKYEPRANAISVYIQLFEDNSFNEVLDSQTVVIVSHGKEGPQGPKGEDAYRVEVLSRNGNTFKNGVIDTWLYAVVYRGEDDITDELDANRFRWERVSVDSTSDILWNQRYFGGVKEIKITTEDVYKRATFTCSVTKQ